MLIKAISKNVDTLIRKDFCLAFLIDYSKLSVLTWPNSHSFLK